MTDPTSQDARMIDDARPAPAASPPRLDLDLNRDCFCIDVDGAHVWAAVAETDCRDEALKLLRAERPHLFASSPVFVRRSDVEAMLAIVEAIEATAQLPAYQAAALAQAPEIARFDPGPRGAFMGYDFHLTPDGPRLIEVNTNAGGAFLNALLAQAQTATCDCAQPLIPPEPLAAFEAKVLAMFEAEWRLQGRRGRPATIAIVDAAPESQYLYPEFRLAQALFARHGVEAVIADPAELSRGGGRLRVAGRPIDLVYNRLTDFALEDPGSRALRDAYLAGEVVVTPNPRHHALLADKRNLVRLADPEWLKSIGVPAGHRHSLAALLPAVAVTSQNAAALWDARKAHVFKPAAGHAGKAVYRGDKLTRGVWASILAGGYVAQAYAPPGERRVQVEGAPQPRKTDVRLYTYAGELLLVAARLYQGQTTNFRTPGGGFAPVVALDRT